MVVSPLQPLSVILSAPVKIEDLSELDSCLVDASFLESFEEAWGDMLQEHSELVPKGQREARIVALQLRAAEIEASKENVEMELRKQSAFFRTSREELEKVYSIKMQDAMNKQRVVHEELSKKLDSIILADSIQQHTLPWLQFVKELESLVSSKGVQQQLQVVTPVNVLSPSEISTPKQGAKPSSKAIFLSEVAARTARKVAATETATATATHVDQQLQAYRIDHALLRTNLNMLLKEIERYEKLNESQPAVGKFLTDNDVWNILKPDASSISNSTVSTVTLPSHATNTPSSKYNKGVRGDGSGNF